MALALLICIQQGTNIEERLLNKPYVNEVTLRGQKPPLKYCQSHELLTQLERESRSFSTGNMGSLGQRNAKLQAIKQTQTRAKHACTHTG